MIVNTLCPIGVQAGPARLAVSVAEIVDALAPMPPPLASIGCSYPVAVADLGQTVEVVV